MALKQYIAKLDLTNFHLSQVHQLVHQFPPHQYQCHFQRTNEKPIFLKFIQRQEHFDLPLNQSQSFCLFYKRKFPKLYIRGPLMKAVLKLKPCN